MPVIQQEVSRVQHSIQYVQIISNELFLRQSTTIGTNKIMPTFTKICTHKNQLKSQANHAETIKNRVTTLHYTLIRVHAQDIRI